MGFKPVAAKSRVPKGPVKVSVDTDMLKNMNVAHTLIVEYEANIPADEIDVYCDSGEAAKLDPTPHSRTLERQMLDLLHGAFDQLACTDGQWVDGFLGCHLYNCSGMGWEVGKGAGTSLNPCC